GKLRVTLVATGLGSAATESERPQVRVVDAQPKKAVGSDVEVDLDQPTVKRRGGDNLAVDYNQQQGIDVLDIPAFLRKQAD
ncbi:MAG: cell division protein FtsZ, partial [Thioalkalivibrio sp.]|nr:cell division protein FtsZ [Thioalkalivibrio sp.]